MIHVFILFFYSLNPSLHYALSLYSALYTLIYTEHTVYPLSILESTYIVQRVITCLPLSLKKQQQEQLNELQ